MQVHDINLEPRQCAFERGTMLLLERVPGGIVQP
jgi:hypothetical protein